MISSPQASNAGHLVEHALTLNIDRLVKAAGLKLGWQVSGQLVWTSESGESSSANFEVRLTIPNGYLNLHFLVSDKGTGSSFEVRQTVRLSTTKPHFGGTRWWFVCPATGEQVGRLHLPPGASQFASRRAHCLTYACKTEDVYDRAARRARKLMIRLGDDIGPPWVPLKPKGMRWATYLRYINQIKAFESVASGRLFKLSARLNIGKFV